MIKFTDLNRKIAGLTKDGCTHENNSTNNKNNKKDIVAPLNLYWAFILLRLK